MTWRERFAFGAWAVVTGYVWITYPRVMAAMLLFVLVVGMFTLAVVAVADRRRPKRR